MVTVAVGMLLAAPLAVKVFTGRDGFVFYRDVICIFAAVAVTLRALHQPLLPYLDVTIAGAGVFHACGRIGCLMSGCCFGRPSRMGVRYRHAHAEMGFPSQLVGVRLFPIQVVESTWIVGLVGFAVLLILRRSSPGAAFAFYVAGYALGRFLFEFARGDADRPYVFGFSQAQWISLLLEIGVVLAGEFRLLPASQWHAATAACMVIAMALITGWRRLERTRRFDLLHPHHVLEIAGGLRQLALSSRQPNTDRKRKIDVVQTSLGMRISAGEIAKNGQGIRHYSLSKAGSRLHSRAARALGNEIALLEHCSAPVELIAGSTGMFHLLLQPEQPSGSRPGQKK
jgi:prolipoprotein diacylglyceryltransferase